MAVRVSRPELNEKMIRTRAHIVHTFGTVASMIFLGLKSSSCAFGSSAFFSLATAALAASAFAFAFASPLPLLLETAFFAAFFNGPGY